MKIAFVGKGGSGKTTLAALFIQYLRSKHQVVLAVDADINMHLAPLLGFDELIQSELHVSNPDNVQRIKTVLKGSNSTIKELSHFRKSTPPGRGSYLISLQDPHDPILSRYAVGEPAARLLVVGSYGTEGIGVSCYHNNLAILENILSHTPAMDGTIVVDMVAGTDAFASTLHAQFDLLVLSVEPTKRGIEVFHQYLALAKEAGIADTLKVVGNKLRSKDDETFIADHIPATFLIGFLYESNYLREIERTGAAIDIERMEPRAIELLDAITADLQSHVVDPDVRLTKLAQLHRSYVAQDFITERFGDLTNQIDAGFSYHRKDADAH